MVWDITLVSGGQLLWLHPLPASCALQPYSLMRQCEKQKSLGTDQGVCHCFGDKSKTEHPMISYKEHKLYSSQKQYRIIPGICHSMLKILVSQAGQVHGGATRGFKCLPAISSGRNCWTRGQNPKKGSDMFSLFFP